MLLKAIIVLDDSLDTEDEGLRQRAARIIVHAAIRSEENENFRQRLDVLDDAFALHKRKPNRGGK